MLQETPVPGIIIPLYTAVPVFVKALSSIWPVQEALRLKRTSTIMCLLQASFALLKTKTTIAADFTGHSTEKSANYTLYIKDKGSLLNGHAFQPEIGFRALCFRIPILFVNYCPKE